MTFLIVTAFAANAQITKNVQLKREIDLMRRMHQLRNSADRHQFFPIKINPYWESIDAPHSYDNSFVGEIQVPTDNSVWTPIAYDSIPNIFCNRFIRTINGGKTWQFDTIQSPYGYVTYNLAATDANTCYASMFVGATFAGSGIFKTTDGGAHWKQTGAGQIFTSSTSNNDFVYFFDKQHGFTVGDGNGANSSHLEIYTTSDAGDTWQRVPDANIPPVAGSTAYSAFVHVYASYQNRIWFRASDENGNNYIYRSDDLGHHWKMFPFNLTDKSYNNLDFVDMQNGIAVGAAFDGVTNSYEAVTHDGGATWTEVTPKGYVMGGFAATIPGTHTIVSTLGGPGYAPIYGSSYSNDYGKSWTLIDSGRYASHCAIAFRSPLVGWTSRDVSLDPNGGMFKWKYHISFDNTASSERDTAAISPLTKDDLSNAIGAVLYPNPATNLITINRLSALNSTTLSVFTSLGGAIQQAIISGESYSLNIQKLPAGSYYVRIRSGGKTETLPFIKQ